jgi:hypothetical protein
MTNGEPPPPPIVTDLQPESVALCPGESIKFVAQTKPPSATVTWKVAVDGGEPERGYQTITQPLLQTFP